MKGRIVVYSSLGCPHCLTAKNILAERDLSYVDIAIDNYPPKIREDMIRLSGGKRSVPQIFFNQVHVGGCSDLEALVVDSERWSELVCLVQNECVREGAPELPDSSLALDKQRSIYEADGYNTLVRQIRAAGLPATHIDGGVTKHNCFTGQALVQWLIQHKHIEETDANRMAAQLVLPWFGDDNKAHVHLDTKQLYSLLEDDDANALNAGPVHNEQALQLGPLAEHMRRLINIVYDRHISTDGKQVDYKSMQGDKDFELYCTMARQLQRAQVQSASHQEKLAFFVNVYNALFIHATVRLGAPNTLWQRWKFFNTVTYIIGGERYALQDIENGVLRGNRMAVGAHKAQFTQTDSRLKVALTNVDPRIHFALNCGGKSCPPVKSYSTENIDHELSLATESFLEDESTGLVIDQQHKEVHVSQIMQWYAQDFGYTQPNILNYVLEHLPEGDKKRSLAKLIEAGIEKIKLNYLPYDWHLNAKY